MSDTKKTKVEIKDGTLFVGGLPFTGNETFTFSNGRILCDGAYKDGLRHGYGIFKKWNEDGELEFHYQGEWEDDKRHGYGKLVTELETYEGDWKRNLRHGNGKAKYIGPDESIEYEGEWVNDHIYGTGKYTSRNNKGTVLYEYEGEVKYKKWHGQGVYTNKNEQGEVVLLYEGGFKDNLRHGHGKMTLHNQTYVGDWSNDERHGYGTEIYPDGSGTFKGEFKNGLRHGHGKIIAPNGTYEGEWANGERHGHGIETDSDGNVTYEGAFINGIQHKDVKLASKDTLNNTTKKESSEIVEIIKRDRHLYAATIKPYLKIKAQKSNDLKPWNSKFLGIPYLPKGHPNSLLFKSNPEIETQESLYLLAQINFQELPHLDFFPEKGILQFWVAKTDTFGLSQDVDQPAGFKVIYYPEVQQDNLITTADLLPSSADNCPFLDSRSEYSLLFEIKEMPITPQDYRFDQLVDVPSELSLLDFKDAYADVHFEESTGYGVHQIGGYPQFAQSDPRVDQHLDKHLLLLQIDSDRINDIWWGDAGTAQFFISETNLKKKDFSNILYHWDCY